MRADLTDIFIDGRHVDAGFGVRIGEPEDNERWWKPRGEYLMMPTPPLIAWLTKRNKAGEYEIQHELKRDAHVHGWLEDGRAFDFEDGLLTIREAREDTAEGKRH